MPISRLVIVTSLAGSMLAAGCWGSAAGEQSSGPSAATSSISSLRLRMARASDCMGIATNVLGTCFVPPDPAKANDHGSNLQRQNCAACCGSASYSRLHAHWVGPAPGNAVINCTQ